MDAVPPGELRRAYDRVAATYDVEFAALQAVKYDAVLSRWRPGDDARVLDLGCGTGLLLLRLAHLRRPPVALDLSGAMLAAASGGVPVQASALALPFADHVFDGVFAVTSLLFAPRDLLRAFLELRRVLLPGGTLALTVLERDVGPGLEEDLAASGFRAGKRFACGQDVGWIATRTAS